MATPVSISAYIAQAQAQGLTWASIRAALQFMAISAVVDNGAVVGTGADGVSVSFSSMDALFAAMQMCRNFEIQDAGAVIMTPEFSPDGGQGVGASWGSN